MTLVNDSLTTVWFEGGVPYGLIWEGRHYRISDTPTHLDKPVGFHEHKPEGNDEGEPGWRFQGTDDDELSRVFDIVRSGTRWQVVRVYT